ncbi:MAG: hypothetical protein WD492_04475 [Alkalispirochaeta sp.]
MSTLQERLADELAALVGLQDTEAAMHFAEHLVRYFVTRETEVDEDLVTRIDHGFASAAADRGEIRDEMRDGFAAAAGDRERIEREAAGDRERIEREAAADRAEIRREMREGFAAAAGDRERIEREAAGDRERIEREAAADRQSIRTEMREGFAAAAAERQRIEREAAADRQDIWEEMREGFAAAAADREELRVSLMAAIEHSAATTKEDLRQEIARLADGMAMFQDAVNRRLAQMTWVTGLLFGSITILLALRGV